MKQKTAHNMIIENRRARFDYTLGEELVCGISLTGPEVRLVRDHHAQLKGSFVTIRGGELWLNNLTLGAETARNIRLLATKKQIANFAKQKTAGFTIVPVKILAGGRHIKIVIALGKGKKSWDKRETIKRRDLDRETRR